MALLLLLLSALWMLALTLVVSLCIAARNGDLQHKPSTPLAVSSEPDPNSVVLRCFLKLGTSGFGGPIALVGYMQRDLVEQRGWFSEAEYRQGLALAQTSSPPFAELEGIGANGWSWLTDAVFGPSAGVCGGASRVHAGVAAGRRGVCHT